VFQVAFPYFSAVFWSLHCVDAPGLGTMGVTETGKLLVDFAAIESWPLWEVVTTLAHETVHVIARHLVRGAHLEQTLGQQASDCAANSWLLEILPEANELLAQEASNYNKRNTGRAQLTPLEMSLDNKLVPPERRWIIPKETFNLPNGLQFEEYVTLLQQKSKPQSGPGKSQGQGGGGQQEQSSSPGQQLSPPQQQNKETPQPGGQTPPPPQQQQQQQQQPGSAPGQGQPQPGSGKPQPGHRPCGACLASQQAREAAAKGQAPRDEHEITEAMWAVLVHQVAKDVQEHQRTRGAGLGGLGVWAVEQLAPPRIRWQDELSRLVRNGYQWVKGQIEQSFARPSRRSEDIILPGWVKPVPRLLIIVDSSGSMTGLYDELFAELGGILQSIGCGEVPVLVGDYGLQQEFRLADLVGQNIQGGGGTSMRTIALEALERQPQPNWIIIATDGYTDWPEEEEIPAGIKVQALLVGKKAPEAPEYIDSLRIEDDEDDA
jgi:predicted metal-dependent peptidase